MNSKPGIIKTAAVTPKTRLADTKRNALEIISSIKRADAAGAGIVLFPELCLTGYSCGDLFHQEQLYRGQLEALRSVVRESAHLKAGVILGCYIRAGNHFYNCAVFVHKGRVLGATPKMFPPGGKEFYEARWFASGADAADSVSAVSIFGDEIPFGSLIFRDEENGFSFGIEICEDLWVPVSPGAMLAMGGAHIIFNPSASDEIVGKPDYRRGLVLHGSAKNICGYVYACAGVYESTADIVFSGHNLIAENGALLAESPLFARESAVVFGEIDYERIKFERSQTQSLSGCAARYGGGREHRLINVPPLRVLTYQDRPSRSYTKTPFIPPEPGAADQRCREIFGIQTAGLAGRLEYTASRKAVVGVSGGLDSALALLVCAEASRLLGRDPSGITAVTMPGFGTTDATCRNALTLMKLIGAEIREIPIREAVLRHFKDIGHDPDARDVTYENAQARERTQILMDIANSENGLVVGAADLSEAALGWSTYNGDHMSMYGVNIGVPKTLVRSMVRWIAEHREEAGFKGEGALLRSTLQSIADTPISPELLPPDENGEIAQKTEEAVGPYVLHDFFLYYTARFGATPKKLLFIAKNAFDGEYDEETLIRWLRVFYSRFFSQQFKRNCMPDGPKVGSVSLSPRGDWRMPSDAYADCWLEDLDIPE
ncbi:MAG: NAD(+) synthase [Clostridiales Family XIII bacterium]|jgi:NAD+ synthase (glutamine-hydrolysing)|nr:NAD(+) synthase [Clostridiales Family XIII bacterium]